MTAPILVEVVNPTVDVDLTVTGPAASIAATPLTVDVNSPEPLLVDVTSSVLAVAVTPTALDVSVTAEGQRGPKGDKGDQGDTGPAGDNSPVFNETPTGVKDGTNVVFTTVDPFRVGSTRITRNGLRETLGVGYSETGGSQVTFSTPPLADDELLIDYIIQ